jgi:uncharacterized membrane protein (UPF0127 family)
MSALQKIADGVRSIFKSTKPALPEGPLHAVNPARSSILATHLEVAASGQKRRKGLLGRDRLAPGEGLWIVPCESVHTFFMRFPIDLVYLDRENRVRKVKSTVGAWRMSVCFSAYSVLELPAGTVRDTKTQRGDTLEFSPVNGEVQGSTSTT